MDIFSLTKTSASLTAVSTPYPRPYPHRPPLPLPLPPHRRPQKHKADYSGPSTKDKKISPCPPSQCRELTGPFPPSVFCNSGKS